MLFYGIGEETPGIKRAAFGTFLLFYYQQIVGVSGTLTGVALAIALFFDAISDPVTGAISDRTHSRWGRRHPYLFISALPLAVFFYLLFSPPDDISEIMAFAWLTVFAIPVRLALTLYDIPHKALGAELASDYVQRTSLFTLATFFGFCGAGTAIILGYVVFFPTTEEYNPGLLNPDRYSPFALLLAILMFFYIITSAVGTFKQIPYLKPATRRAGMRWYTAYVEICEAFKNKSFRRLFFGIFVTTFIAAIEGIFAPFMGFHFWGLTTEQLTLAYVIGPTFGLPLSIWLVPKVTMLYDKRTVLIVSCLITVLVGNWAVVCRLMGAIWFPENSSPWILVIICVNMFLITAIMPAIYASIDSMMADIADEIDLETGERREGILYSARAFALKATAGIGLIVGGILLDFIEFPKNAEAGSVAKDVVWQLGFVVGPATSAFTLVGVLLFYGYPLTRSRHLEIIQALKKRDSVLISLPRSKIN